MDDKHVVEFSEDGYGLQHPKACRPNLLGCEFHKYLKALAEPDMEPGRYIIAKEAFHFTYEALSA